MWNALYAQKCLHFVNLISTDDDWVCSRNMSRLKQIVFSVVLICHLLLCRRFGNVILIFGVLIKKSPNELVMFKESNKAKILKVSWAFCTCELEINQGIKNGLTFSIWAKRYIHRIIGNSKIHQVWIVLKFPSLLIRRMRKSFKT